MLTRESNHDWPDAMSQGIRKGRLLAYIRSALGKVLEAIGLEPYAALDTAYLPRDRKRIRWARNLRLIPGAKYRRGGQSTYAEWAEAIGVFQALIATHITSMEDNHILDVGCGTGLVGTACEPFLGSTGLCTGIDVKEENVEFCRSHYPPSRFRFVHINTYHPVYAPRQETCQCRWPLPDESYDLVTAAGVWSDMNEQDALFYFKEVNRVLKPGSKAIITCFLIDQSYYEKLRHKSGGMGRYHMTPQDKWIFDQPAYGSTAWFYPKGSRIPESAVGITPEGIERLTEHAGMRQVEHYQGKWKEVPGILFQDVLVFQKSGEGDSA